VDSNGQRAVIEISINSDMSWPPMMALHNARRTIAAASLLLVLLVAGCKRQRGSTGDPTADLPARFKTQQEVPPPNFAEAARNPQFQAAIKEIAALLGTQPQPLNSDGEGGLIAGGVSFDVPEKVIAKILLQTHTNMLAKGFYFFRYDPNYGMAPDRVGLLPTTDKYAVMAAMETNGDNFDIGTAGVIAWMKELEQEQPYVLTGIGFDYMEGNFTSAVKDPTGLARRMYQFCPDIVDQGVETVAALATELKKGALYFWWD
jgi:hypothetical protein